MNSTEPIPSDPVIAYPNSSTAEGSQYLRTIRTPLIALLLLMGIGCFFLIYLLLVNNFSEPRGSIPTNSPLLTVICLVFFIAAMVLILMGLHQTRIYEEQIQHLANLLSKVDQGNYVTVSKEPCTGPLARLLNSLNSIFDSMATQMNEKEVHAASREKSMGLLVDISSMREGDLTVRGDVTDDAQGAIADSFNALVESFSEVISRTRSSCFDGLKVSRMISTECSTLIDINLHQAKSVTSALQVAKASLKVLTDSPSSTTADSTALPPGLLTSLKKSGVSARDSIKKTSNLLNETESTLKSFKKNVTSLQEAADFLNRLADKMSILALNASIQTSMVGDSGGGFEEICEEMQRLSGNSGDFARRVNLLVEDHQTDIEDLQTFTADSIEASASNQIHVAAIQNELQLIHDKTAIKSETAHPSTKETDQEKRLQNLMETLEQMAEVCRQSVLVGTRTGDSIESLSDSMINLQNSLAHFMICEDETTTKQLKL